MDYRLLFCIVGIYTILHYPTHIHTEYREETDIVNENGIDILRRILHISSFLYVPIPSPYILSTPNA